MFRLRTFGGLWLERDHQRVGGASPRRLGLLAAVVAAGDRGISRDRLLLLLWPDTTETKARHALAQTLYSLRRELGDELLRSETAELLVDPQRFGSDLADFLDAKARGDVERASELYSGPFLDGFYIPGADEFERWAEIERTRLRELAIQAMEAAARQATAAGRLEAASAHWRRLSVIAPLNSRVAPTAELALARGAPEAAIEAIRNDIDPSLAVWRAALVGRIMAGRGVLNSALAVTAAFARSEGFGGDTQGDWVLAPLEVARIAEALGDSATARRAADLAGPLEGGRPRSRDCSRGPGSSRAAAARGRPLRPSAARQPVAVA